jgi:hypothetical protein
MDGGIFGGGSPDPPPPPPPPPSEDTTNSSELARQRRDLRKNRRGRYSLLIEPPSTPDSNRNSTGLSIPG